MYGTNYIWDTCTIIHFKIGTGTYISLKVFNSEIRQLRSFWWISSRET
jgi:hypothetical protein